MSFHFGCGMCQPASSFTLKDKGSISSSITMHYCIYLCKTQLDEVKKGLESIQFLDALKKHPVLRSLFEHFTSKLTADVLEGGASERGNPPKGGVGDAPDHSSSTCRRIGERGF